MTKGHDYDGIFLGGLVFGTGLGTLTTLFNTNHTAGWFKRHSPISATTLCWMTGALYTILGLALFTEEEKKLRDASTDDQPN